MLLVLADGLAEGRRLQTVLSGIGPCALATLDDPAPGSPGPAAVVCDAALEPAAALAAVRSALARCRPSAATPVLHLDRHGGAAALALAGAIGATAVLPRRASDAQILFTLRRLLENAKGPRARPAAQRLGELRRAAASLAEIFTAARGGGAVSPGTLERGADAVTAAVRGDRIGTWLDVVRAVDDALYQHCLVVAGLSMAFAARLGVTPRGQHLITGAALVHDIGKASIPPGILNKPGTLTPEETALLRTHPAAGHRMLADQGGFEAQILDVVRHHHEYLDGSGYPDGLGGEAVSAPVRLVTICDIYAALIERRSYKSPVPLADALRVLDGMAGKLDRGMLRTFGALVREGA